MPYYFKSSAFHTTVLSFSLDSIKSLDFANSKVLGSKLGDMAEKGAQR
jgi:hypothetical protein